MSYSSVSLSLFDKLSSVREALAFPPLLSVSEDDNALQNVFFAQASLQCALDLDNAEVSIANLESELDNALADSGSDLALRLLDRFVTHASIQVTEEEDKLLATFQVYYHYLELEPVGQMIDGDLVVQGLSIRDNYGPAFCTLEHAATSNDDFTEISTVGPWSFMLTASEGDAASGDVAHKAAQFMIPISVPDEYQRGIIRVKIYVDQADQIPYDEEPLDDNGDCTYNMKSVTLREKTICAVSLIKQSTATEETGISERDASDPEVGISDLDGLGGAGENTPGGEEGSRRSRDGTTPSPKPDSTNGGEGHGDGEDIVVETVRSARSEASDREISAALAGTTLGEIDTSEHPQEASLGAKRESFLDPAIASEALLLEQAKGVIADIRIASDYDDVLALQSEGYELHCTHVTAQGPLAGQEHLWKFHVMARYATENESTGLEDVTWVKCLKSLGTLPNLPLFQILHDYDLSEEDDTYALYLAYKVGPNPSFKRLVMLSASTEDEKLLVSYIGAFTAAFRAAPASLSKAMGGPSGLFLMIDANPVDTGNESRSKRNSPTRDSPKLRGHGHSYDGTHSKGGSSVGDRPESDVEDESDDEDYGDEVEQLASLQQRIADMITEKQGLTTLNAELQKKAVALIAKEKAMQGQTAAARTAAEVASTVAENMEVAAEQNIEKERQYQDTLQLIVDERHKLNKQLKEFDQLALDLQTRLDDKELKANGIQNSFKQFKKEILSKAENSRTGHGISLKQVQHFEASEQKHEEDLERVRLRNISLRTTFRKLERTLRAREQLAEGLHMIDFEQLKIENQTLNEKIEERNEELAKLKRKKTTTVQVLTHIREKLRFVEKANEGLSEKLAHLENTSTELRNIVTVDKLYRDELRFENKELRAKQGFATSDLLLVDYESRCTKVEQLKAATTELKSRYGTLARQVNKSLKNSTATPWVMSNSNVMK